MERLQKRLHIQAPPRITIDRRLLERLVDAYRDVGRQPSITTNEYRVESIEELCSLPPADRRDVSLVSLGNAREEAILTIEISERAVTAHSSIDDVAGRAWIGAVSALLDDATPRRPRSLIHEIPTGFLLSCLLGASTGLFLGNASAPKPVFPEFIQTLSFGLLAAVICLHLIQARVPKPPLVLLALHDDELPKPRSFLSGQREHVLQAFWPVVFAARPAEGSDGAHETPEQVDSRPRHRCGAS